MKLLNNGNIQNIDKNVYNDYINYIQTVCTDVEMEENVKTGFDILKKDLSEISDKNTKQEIFVKFYKKYKKELNSDIEGELNFIKIGDSLRGLKEEQKSESLLVSKETAKNIAKRADELRKSDDGSNSDWDP